MTSLEDNVEGNEYCYEIIVVTGHRRNAGTRSNVHFVVVGDDNETDVRTFSDSHRQIFQRGSIDAFVMSVPK